MTDAVRDLRPTLALLVCGVLVFADDARIALVGAVTTISLLLAIGFRSGRLRATGWAGLLVVSGFVADTLWWVNWEPFNRSDEWEAIPQTPFVLLVLPVPMAVIALGAAARMFLSRPTPTPDD